MLMGRSAFVLEVLVDTILMNWWVLYLRLLVGNAGYIVDIISWSKVNVLTVDLLLLWNEIDLWRRLWHLTDMIYFRVRMHLYIYRNFC